MSVSNCWYLPCDLSIYLFGFLPVLHYFSCLMCMYTYLVLIMWCNMMWAFFCAALCRCCSMYVLYNHAACLSVSCIFVWCGSHFLSHPTRSLSLSLCCCHCYHRFCFCCFWECLVCVVLWCESLLVVAVAIVGINWLSLLNNYYLCHVTRQPCIMLLCSWISLQWPLLVVSVRKEACDDEPDGLKHVGCSVMNYDKSSGCVGWWRVRIYVFVYYSLTGL